MIWALAQDVALFGLQWRLGAEKLRILQEFVHLTTGNSIQGRLIAALGIPLLRVVVGVAPDEDFHRRRPLLQDDRDRRCRRLKPPFRMRAQIPLLAP